MTRALHPTSVADVGFPGKQKLRYWILCQALRRPGLWRAIGSLLRKWPRLAAMAKIAARSSAVKALLWRPESFLNTSHAPNLVAGSFLIGMESGARYADDKEVLRGMLRSEREFEDRSADEAGERAKVVGEKASFDLVDDYLKWVVHRATEADFGNLSTTIAGVVPRVDEVLESRYLLDLRNVAAQLVGGKDCPADVKRRAQASAMELSRRFDRVFGMLAESWTVAAGATRFDIERVAMGLSWVSHPVTVQAGALMVVELLGRPMLHDDLRARVARAGAGALHDPVLREEIRWHVLELMRFRPVFPLLSRDVARDTSFEVEGKQHARCPAGAKVVALSMSALFDPEDVDDPEGYRADRWQGKRDEDWMMFGHGPRMCPARNQATTVLVSALIGLLAQEKRLGWQRGSGSGRLVTYDGPMIAGMAVAFA